MSLSIPSLGGLLTLFRDEAERGIHTAFPGIVQSYDASKQTCTVQPAVKQIWIDEENVRHSEPLPQLVDVPVVWPYGGGFALTCPLAAHDTVLIIIAESALENWRAKNPTTNPVDPSDPRRFDLNDAIAIPGLLASPKALTTASSSKLVLGKDGGLRIEIDASNIYLSADATDYVALSTKVNDRISAVENSLNDLISKYNSHTHPYVDTPVGPSVTSPTATSGSPLTPGSSTAATKVKAK